MISAEIPAEFESFIQYQLATGGHHSGQEVLSDALRLLREQKLDTLRKEIQVGVDDLECGDEIIIEDEQGMKRFFDELEAEAPRNSRPSGRNESNVYNSLICTLRNSILFEWLCRLK